MIRAQVAIVLAALLAAGRVVGVADAQELHVGRWERLLIVAPHPDDETLGAGGLARRVLEHDGTVRVVLVTAGDGYVEAVVHDSGRLRPRPAEYIAYGERRLGEARAALRALHGGILLQVLGFPDGRIASLLDAHWWRRSPERSPTTERAHPPYAEALDRNLPYDGDDLRRELVGILRETQPTIVALPDFLDRHPDHRATGIFTLLALRDWVEAPDRVPRLLAYLVHWPGWPPGWDAPRGRPAGADTPLELPADLPGRGYARTFVSLQPRDVAAKRAALGRYESQQEVMPALLAAFVRRTEPFTVLDADAVWEAGDLVPSHTAHPDRSSGSPVR